MILLEWVTIVVLTIIGFAVLFSFIWSAEGLWDTKSKGLIKRYLENAKKLSQVKMGEYDPFDAWGNIETTEYIAYKIMGVLWSLLPFLLLVGIVFLIKFLCCYILGWIIIGSIVGLIAIFKLICKFSSIWLNWMATLSEKDNKIAKVLKGVKKLADQ